MNNLYSVCSPECIHCVKEVSEIYICPCTIVQECVGRQVVKLEPFTMNCILGFKFCSDLCNLGKIFHLDM